MTVESHEQKTATAAPEAEAKKPIPTGYFIVGAMGLFFAIAFGTIVVWALFAEKPENLKKRGSSALPILGEVPEFTLTDRTGKDVSRASLEDKVWIADFVFTRCAGPCRIMTGNMRELRAEIDKYVALDGKIDFVSVTVDPEYDTQEVLNDYAIQWRATSPAWKFVRGDYEDIQALARDGFKLGLSKANPDTDDPIIHSNSFVLVDGKSRIRGYYDGTNAKEVEDLHADALRLVTELEEETPE